MSVTVPRNNWFVAARSNQLRKNRVLARKIVDVPIVLYRSNEGTPIVLLDRCPHKNVPLSMGRLERGQLECRYHGWRFDHTGRCLNVPCHEPSEKLPDCQVPTFTTVEQDGWIWI